MNGMVVLGGYGYDLIQKREVIVNGVQAYLRSRADYWKDWEHCHFNKAFQSYFFTSKEELHIILTADPQSQSVSSIITKYLNNVSFLMFVEEVSTGERSWGHSTFEDLPAFSECGEACVDSKAVQPLRLSISYCVYSTVIWVSAFIAYTYECLSTKITRYRSTI